LFSLGLTLILAVAALFIGAIIALILIRHRARESAAPGERLSLLRLSSRDREE
jgi:hypothetical protein